MSEPVVHRLEVVDVEHEQRDRAAIAGGAARFGLGQGHEFVAVPEAGHAVARRPLAEIFRPAFRPRSLLDRVRKPAQQQHAEDDAARDDVGNLGQDEEVGIAQNDGDAFREQAVFAAEIRAEIRVLDDVADGVDRDDDEQEPGRPEGAAIAPRQNDRGRQHA
ncbi:MAG: hypothetical protein JO255_14170 [Alphaproteobacteria bacterium]|nr:hypothetical protein [Alphaproteobacteria bacterium]